VTQKDSKKELKWLEHSKEDYLEHSKEEYLDWLSELQLAERWVCSMELMSKEEYLEHSKEEYLEWLSELQLAERWVCSRELMSKEEYLDRLSELQLAERWVCSRELVSVLRSRIGSNRCCCWGLAQRNRNWDSARKSTARSCARELLRTPPWEVLGTQ